MPPSWERKEAEYSEFVSSMACDAMASMMNLNLSVRILSRRFLSSASCGEIGGL